MEPIPYRIRLGVTGHRKLENKDTLTEKINTILKSELISLFDDKSKKLIQKSTSTPITYSLLTPLAEGADRLVAEAVLNYNDLSTIDVVLPLTLSDYKKTFEDPEDEQFVKLYDKARKVIKLRKYDMDNDPEINIHKNDIPIETKLDESKKESYEKVGRYVVNHCDVLIALWDGMDSRGKGGTKEIIEYAHEKKRPVIIISTIAPNNIEIVKGFGLNGDAIGNIDRFNNKKIPSDVESKYIKNLDNIFFSNPDAVCLPENSKQLLRDLIFPYYIKSSLMAKKSQRIYKPSGNLIYICSALAILSVLFGLLYPPAFLGAFIVEFFSLTAILAVYFFAQNFRNKWLESRFLTERLRSACFFIISNLEITSIEIPSHMGIAHKYNDWMVQVFNEVWSKLPQMKGLKIGDLQCSKKYILSHWIDDQAVYHTKKSKNLHKSNNRFKSFGWIIYTIALLTSGVHIAHELLGGLEGHHIIENILIFLAIALPATGAAVVSIRKHGEYERIETRSENMSKAIQDLKIDFNLISEVKEFEKLMYQFDELMLRENQDWLMLMKLVKLEVYP